MGFLKGVFKKGLWECQNEQQIGKKNQRGTTHLLQLSLYFHFSFFIDFINENFSFV
jgi:hypothetical protein